MEDFIKLIVPFLSTSKNYSQMLKKLAMLTFYETYIISLVLRTNPAVNIFLARIETWGAVGNVVKIIPHYDAINVSGIAIAILLAFLSHMFQLHDLVSDVLGIRRAFDRKYILTPLANGVGIKLTKALETKMGQRRDKLVHAVFYKYATSSEKECVVDKHDMEQALDAWSWFGLASKRHCTSVWAP